MINEEIIKQYSQKYNLSYNVAKERLVDNEIRRLLFLDGKSFKFDKNIIELHIKTRTTDDKRRIRYILRNCIGELNYYYKKLYLKKKLSRDWKKELTECYNEAKGSFQFKYSTPGYISIVYSVFKNYLTKSYKILQNVLHEAGYTEGISESNILLFFKKNYLIQTTDELKESLRKEGEKLKADLERDLDKELKEMELEAKLSCCKEVNFDYNEEKEIMTALKNGNGDIHGLG
jgi:hypothetical protein